AKALLLRFIEEYVSEIVDDLASTRDLVVIEVLKYVRICGKKVRVRMMSGRLQPHKVFDPKSPDIVSYFAPASPRDGNLPIYAAADYRYLQGFLGDLNEKATELGIPWDSAVDVLRSLNRASGTELALHPSEPPAKAAGVPTPEKLKNPQAYPI